MSHLLINHSPDLKKLRDEGFEVEIKGAYLLVHNVPYVNSKKEISFGSLVTNLSLTADITIRPDTHVIYFIGEHPCNKDGNIIEGIKHQSQEQNLDSNNGLITNHSFSSRPPKGYYDDYYEKITTYVKIIMSQAEAINPDVKVKTFKVIENDEISNVFNYLDTNSSRAEINDMSNRLSGLKIAIIGLGGTGSYVLDLVSKTSVKEIHIFDGDILYQHNAFRIPGAISKEELDCKPKKVSYHFDIYSKIHKKNTIVPHDYYINSSNLEEILEMDFVFICIDNSDFKEILINKLIENNNKFIDTGIGVDVIDGLIKGSIRITASDSSKNDHVKNRISFSDDGNDDYSQNIQIAELNSLNASLAVIKWKKMFNYYHDLTKDYNSIYNIDINNIINDETNS